MPGAAPIGVAAILLNASQRIELCDFSMPSGYESASLETQSQAYEQALVARGTAADRMSGPGTDPLASSPGAARKDIMSNYWSSLVVGIAILAAAVPYVARIRHPAQKPLAAYLIFVTVFGAVAIVLFSLLLALAARLGLGPSLDEVGPALLFLLLVFVPAIAAGSWLARKPPWRQGPPA